MSLLDNLILFLVLFGTLGAIVLLILSPVIVSWIKLKIMKRKLDKEIALLPEVFKNSVQIITEPLGLGSMECESTTIRFEDVQKHSKTAVAVVLNSIDRRFLG